MLLVRTQFSGAVIAAAPALSSSPLVAGRCTNPPTSIIFRSRRPQKRAALAGDDRNPWHKQTLECAKVRHKKSPASSEAGPVGLDKASRGYVLLKTKLHSPVAPTSGAGR